MTSLKVLTRCRSKSFGCLDKKCARFIKFLRLRGCSMSVVIGRKILFQLFVHCRIVVATVRLLLLEDEQPMMPYKKEVIKHSAAVHIQNNITLLQRRSWNVLLANAYDELPTEEEHHIAVKDLARMLDFDSKNDTYLKEALEALVGCKVKWNVLDKDGEEEWGVTTL